VLLQFFCVVDFDLLTAVNCSVVWQLPVQFVFMESLK
jgi:hypothetical protein